MIINYHYFLFPSLPDYYHDMSFFFPLFLGCTRLVVVTFRNSPHFLHSDCLQFATDVCLTFCPKVHTEFLWKSCLSWEKLNRTQSSPLYRESLFAEQQPGQVCPIFYSYAQQYFAWISFLWFKKIPLLVTTVNLMLFPNLPLIKLGIHFKFLRGLFFITQVITEQKQTKSRCLLEILPALKSSFVKKRLFCEMSVIPTFSSQACHMGAYKILTKDIFHLLLSPCYTSYPVKRLHCSNTICSGPVQVDHLSLYWALHVLQWY